MLTVRDLSVAYGPIPVLRRISFEVPTGAIVSLIGPNGAGKTTTLRALSGLKPAAEGSVELDGMRITTRSPQEIVKLGVAHVPEGRKIFRNLTVLENLKLGGFVRAGRGRTAANVERLIDLFPMLRERLSQMGGTLSGGQQQILALARALCSEPKILLLDEPSMGLAPQIVREVGQVIRQIRERGITVLLVEQNARLALKLSNRVYVMDHGEMVAQGTSDELVRDERVTRTYLGG